jgi:hypothetical protein
VTNNSRLTATVAGKFHVFAHITFAVNATGYREIIFRVDGTTAPARVTIPAVNANLTVHLSSVISLAANSYVECRAWQSSGGALNVNTSAVETASAP